MSDAVDQKVYAAQVFSVFVEAVGVKITDWMNARASEGFRLYQIAQVGDDYILITMQRATIA